MRQTFQQWMVLLSALVLLLLPALLCHATPMESRASSSSGPHDPALNAESNVRGDRPGIKEFSYYYHLQPKPDLPTLTNEELEKQFHAQIHIEGLPVLFSNTVEETKVQHALEHYGKVWIVGPSTTSSNYPESMLLEKEIKKGKVTIKQDVSSRREFDWALDHLESFGRLHGDNAMYLTYGPPFAKPKNSPLRFIGYKKSNSKKVSTRDLPKLEEAGLANLRTHLQEEKYLNALDSDNRLLSFTLDQDGKVLFEELGQYHPLA
ncbi:uncharacterized protein UDID_19097 [Ustilago sp. UG-2017a]|nr:uncharacterized protein UDID_19097 [Ustilago sp. UG-2017a]